MTHNQSSSTDARGRGGHPWWCALGHHCTADRIGARGEHTSAPEVWDTPGGRLVATRYRRADAARDRVEIRAVVDLDPADDNNAQEHARAAIVAVHLALTDPARTTRELLKGDLR